MIPVQGRVALLLAIVPCAVQAQRVEVRVDAVGDPVVWHTGAGLTWALGGYARISAIGSYGVNAPSARQRWRGDILARVSLDPFRRHRFGLSIGGGLTFLERPYLLAAAEIEGPSYRGLTVALQGALGGGPRLGLLLRAASDDRR